MKSQSMKATLRGAALASLLVSSGLALADANWLSAGQGSNNGRSQASETKISPASVVSLAPLWAAAVAGDVTANPAVEGDFLYVPDSAGWLYALKRSNGQVVWKAQISNYTGYPGDWVRATPAISGNALIFGNQNGKNVEFFGQTPPQGAWVLAVDKTTGALLWKTQIEAAKRSMVTHSAIIAKGMAIVGVASNDEFVSGLVPKSYWTWEGRGSVVALDVNTGAIKWKTYTVPQGYFGGSVWGSTGAVDLKRSQVYMATGDNFWAPESVQACVANAQANKTDPIPCHAADDYFDAVIALDIDTGKVNWGQHGIAYDTWNVGCGLNIPGVFTILPNDNCPNPKGPDWDFAQGPILINNGNGGGDNDLVGAGQKSGVFFAFKAKDGKLAWSTQVAPGGLTGGLQWGSAYDGARIYVAVAQAGAAGAGVNPEPWKLKDGSTTTAGGWAALDPKNGKILWTTPDPYGNRAEAAVSVANGVMFGCTLNYNPGAPTYFALNAATGAVAWSFRGPANPGAGKFGACQAGPSIADGMVYWGSGTAQGTGLKLVYGFGLP